MPPIPSRSISPTSKLVAPMQSLETLWTTTLGSPALTCSNLHSRQDSPTPDPQHHSGHTHHPHTNHRTQTCSTWGVGACAEDGQQQQNQHRTRAKNSHHTICPAPPHATASRAPSLLTDTGKVAGKKQRTLPSTPCRPSTAASMAGW